MDILNYFPNNIKNALCNIPVSDYGYLNEINIITGQPVFVKIRGRNFFLGSVGIVPLAEQALFATKEDTERIFELITQSSSYAYRSFISEGYLTLCNGHRVGITGNCITDNTQVININNFNSFCFRVNQDVQANIDIAFDDIYCNGTVKNTIIISPPGCGKTTFLRTIARRLSGCKKQIIKSVIIDERYEIAACKNGYAGLDIGISSSVISGLKKSIAIPMVVRSMSPDVIITDELATHEDTKAIRYAKASGCSIIASVHGSDENNNELKYYNIKDIFDIKIVLSLKNGPGTVEKIIRGD